MAACWPSGGARIQSQEPREFRGAQRMQNIRYATELLHVLRTGLVGRHRVEKLCNLILSFSWKSPAVRQTTLSSSAKWVSEGRQLVFLLHLLWNQIFLYINEMQYCSWSYPLDRITFYKYFCKETLFLLDLSIFFLSFRARVVGAPLYWGFLHVGCAQ